MKTFCVTHKLNKLKDYDSVSKKKKTLFLEWIVSNADKIKQPLSSEDSKKSTSSVSKNEKSVKKDITVETPKGLSSKKPDIEFPEFKDVSEMKAFCVKYGLNKIDGYIIQTKGNKDDFLKWMLDNKDKAALISNESINLTKNPHSPNQGIGELQINNDNTSAAKGIIGSPNENDGDGKPVEDIGKVEKTDDSVNVSLPPLQTNSNPQSVIPSTQNSFEPTTKKVIEKAAFGQGNPQMEIEAQSVVEHLNNSFQARFHGGMLVADFKPFLDSSLGKYNPEIHSINGLFFFTINDGNGNQSKFPKEGGLPLR